MNDYCLSLHYMQSRLVYGRLRLQTNRAPRYEHRQ